MRIRIRSLGESMRSGLWLIPAVCVISALALALVLVRIDRATEGEKGWTFGAGAAGAREVLSAITTSMITFTGLVFSITVVVLQLASSQFSPRVLRTFLRDWLTQLSLGVFVATFVYTMTVLRTVRSEVDDEFVPALATSVAFGLLLVSVGMFIAYIHHITRAIRVSSILQAIGDETRSTMNYRYPEDAIPVDAAKDEFTASESRVAIAATAPGVITSIDLERLVALATSADAVIVVPHPVGGFVPEGAALLHMYGASDDVDRGDFTACVRTGRERTMEQDVAFGLRQLVDVAERALSPGVNDPTTAVQALDQIHDLLRRLVSRPLDDGSRRDNDDVLRLLTRAPTCADYLHLGLSEIAQYGNEADQVQRKLRELRADLLTAARPENREAVAAALEPEPSV